MRRWVWRILLAVAVMAALTVGASAVEVTTSDGIKLTDAGNEWTVIGYTGKNVKVEIPNTYEGKPVTAIGSKAFTSSSVTSVSIPENVTSIGSQAFFGASLSALEIPGTVTTIGESAFEQCRNLKTVKFLDVAGSGGGAAKTTIGPRAFAACGALDTLKLTGNVGSIGDGAFTSCGVLSKVIIWEGTTSVGKDAFQLCNRLTQVVIPSSASVSAGAFSACQTLSVVHYAGDNSPPENALPATIKRENIHKVAIDRSVGTATCTKGADVVERVGCLTTGCSFRHEETQSLPALGHDWIETEVPDGKTHPDCETWIKTVEVTCSRAAVCGYVKTTRQETVKAIKPHEPVALSEADQERPENIKSNEPATCGADGSKTVVTERCNICGIELNTETKTIPATGNHDPAKEVKTRRPITPATCSTAGEEEVTVTCGDCGTVLRVVKKPLPATGKHEWNEPDFVTTKEPTCTEEGTKVKKQLCKNCGAENPDYNIGNPPEEEKIDPLGHDLEEEKETITEEPTCTEDGEKTIHARKCLRDGCDYVEPEQTGIVVEKLGHEWDTIGEEIIEEPTCQKEGKKKVSKRVCTRCKIEENGGIVSIPKTAHTWGNPLPTTTDKDGNPVKDIPPKCGDPGVAHVIVSCQNKFADGTVCDAKEYQAITLPATGVHTWGEWKAGEDGKEIRTCSVCGKTDSRDLSPTEPTDPDDPDKPTDPDKPSKPEDSTYKVELVQSSNGTFYASHSTAKQGETVTVTYTPNSGYVLDMIRVIGTSSLVPYTDLGGGRFRFTMPASNVEVRVTFDRTDADYSGNWSDGFGNSGDGNRSDPRRTTDVTPVQSQGYSVPKADAQEQVFRDVPTGHWAAGEINWASEMGYMSGTGGRFNPDGLITHQQMWMVLARLTGANPANMAEANHWAVRGGYADGSSPTGAVKRHQLVTALYRCARLTGSVSRNNTSLAGYTDSGAVPVRAREAFSWALSSGVVSGDADGRLNPAKTLTRAEFAAILYCYSQRS